jgi:endonuclease/exonuclease/phosphatase family metal-dependent hydrolase
MTPSKKNGSSTWVKILFVINCLFILCLFVSYAAPYISPARYWIFAFFGLAYPVWLAINLVFVLLWIILWKKYAWITLAAILIGVNHLLSIYPVSFPKKKPLPEGTFKIMTYNVHSLYGIHNRKIDQGAKSKVTEFLREQQPDILCIQEFYVRSEDSSKVLERFTRDIGSSYYSYKNYFDMKDRKRINALAIFSKFPISGSGYIRAKNRYVFCIYADILVGDIKLRVYDLHLESIRFGNEDYSFYAHLTDNESENTNLGTGSRKILSKLKKAFAMRAEQVDILRREMDKSPFPLIVCGDFNDSPTSYTYHMLSGNLTDSYKKAGSGLFGNTFAGNLPSYRIDYLLSDKQLDVFNYERLKVGLSDHYPVSAWMKFSSNR